MSWEILNKNIQRWTSEREKLQQIAAIVAARPEWLESDPKLKQLVESVNLPDAA